MMLPTLGSGNTNAEPRHSRGLTMGAASSDASMAAFTAEALAQCSSAPAALEQPMSLGLRCLQGLLLMPSLGTPEDAMGIW